MSTYEQLHRQCRTLENLLDTKINSYSQLVSSLTRSAGDDIEANGATERWKDLELEVEELLEKLEETNDKLGELSKAPDTLSPSMLRAIQRHRELYQDNAREVKRTKASVKNAMDNATLLSGVRNDIEAYHSSAADSLLAERGRIDSSHRMIDDTLSQAYETRSEFARQRFDISGINSRMTGVIGSMPAINNVVGMIKSRRRRDQLIIGGLIGLCMFVLLWYLW
ncbi:V-snare-domain-containing protein [Cylindrobasidium torrendii FP15055 ss-10]|uniref:Golgi SNAP receptor complex member 1 n=1 Tax=Cylindrobasidium torrendii FP15055 ss-10 TaxID=1314674 RepID=A0A0D7BSP8_9AGAR|nr:V-snare-domain-containing protein [Cylindrobasidium torrendii FP15055 ss-10]